MSFRSLSQCKLFTNTIVKCVPRVHPKKCEDSDFKVLARTPSSAGEPERTITIRPAQVLLFGNPAIGTPMMIAAPTLAIDLPFKALVWEGEAGRVWLTFNALDYLEKRHDIPEKCAGSLNTLAELVHEVARPQQPETKAEHLM